MPILERLNRKLFTAMPLSSSSMHVPRPERSSGSQTKSHHMSPIRIMRYNEAPSFSSFFFLCTSLPGAKVLLAAASLWQPWGRGSRGQMSFLPSCPVSTRAQDTLHPRIPKDRPSIHGLYQEPDTYPDWISSTPQFGKKVTVTRYHDVGDLHAQLVPHHTTWRGCRL